MAASVAIYRWTGGSPGTAVADLTAATSFYVAEDAHYAVSPPNPVVVPAAGSNYSFWVSLRLKCTVAPTTLLNNLKFYTNAPYAGIPAITFLGQSANVGADAGYRQATGTVGTTGDTLNLINHTGLTAAPVDPFTFTSGAPMTLAGSTAGIGDFGDFVALQAVIASTSTGTTQANMGVTFQWDET